jgi:hypothetical protein
MTVMNGVRHNNHINVDDTEGSWARSGLQRNNSGEGSRSESSSKRSQPTRVGMPIRRRTLRLPSSVRGREYSFTFSLLKSTKLVLTRAFDILRSSSDDRRNTAQEPETFISAVLGAYD